ncbi:hypothetical protein J2S43_007837 [Catenuloplanes nepalensis]|uniref:DUF2637 domain-containing protein n=1 Tax=Catenuloplanes nepalensis TaxID=587533 RepID=A0ABT9N6J7_9ACTN|nr:hypothetical protein [Catenuloplanes nepalensis]
MTAPTPMADLLPRARALTVEQGEVPSLRQLKSTLGVGFDKARRIRTALESERTSESDSRRRHLHRLSRRASPARRLPVRPLPRAESAATEAPAAVLEYDAEATMTAQLTSPVAEPAAVAPDRESLRRLVRVRWAVRGTLLLGVAASVIANVLHAIDNPISQAIAAWPPFALLLTVELISRVPVHRRSLAYIRMIATTAIAGIAAWISYWHMAGVAARYGESASSAHLIPLSVDGLIVVASICLVELGGRISEAQASAAVAQQRTDELLHAGIPAEYHAPANRPDLADRPLSDFARAAHALPYPPLGTSEPGLHGDPTGTGERPDPAPEPEERTPEEVVTVGQEVREDSRTDQEIEALIRAVIKGAPGMSQRAIARAAGVSTHKVRKVVRALDEQPGAGDSAAEAPDAGRRAIDGPAPLNPVAVAEAVDRAISGERVDDELTGVAR